MDQLLSLIGQLYDAALDPDLWTGVLRQLDVYYDTAQTWLAIEDTADTSASYFYSSVEVPPQWLDRYVKSYMLINPTRLAMAYRVKPGDTVITTDFMTPTEYSATRFSREFLADMRIADIAVGILEQTSTRYTVLSAQRNYEQGFADETLRRKLELVTPHAQRAVKIARVFEHQKMAASTLAETLDKLAAGVFMLTPSGAIVHANEQGAALLAEGDVAQVLRGKLTLFDKAAEGVLTDALDRAAQGDAALGPDGRVAPARSRSERMFVVTIMPLTAGRRSAIGSPHDAVAAVCIKEAEFETSTGAGTLAALHGLTRREMAILTAAVELSGVSEIAVVMGISVATVRTHLKAIFRKTGATRQADLVKLMAGIAGPFGATSATGTA